MKLRIQWLLVAAVLLAIAASAGRAIMARKAQQQALATAPKAQTLVEVAAGDLVKAAPVALAQGLPVSGALKAVNTAVIKAKVAGELQGLTLREGDTVQAGQVVGRIDPTEYQSRVRQAQEQADAARAQIDIAQRQFDNNKALVEQGFISRTALDTSLATLQGAQASHKAAVAALDVAKKALDDTVLRSPIAGQVATRSAQPGERVAIDGRVLEIVDLARLELEAALGAADSVQVRVGQQASLLVEGNPVPYTARVVRINPSAQAGSRSVLVYLGIDKPAGLRQGLYAQGTLGTAQTTTLAVPLSTVRTDQPAPYVQVVENGVVAHKPVELGVRGESGNDIWVAVRGVADQTQVLQGALGPLRAGTPVRLTSSR